MTEAEEVTIALPLADVRRATQLLERLLELSGATPSSLACDAQRRLALAQMIAAARAARTRFFAEIFFGEAAWDLLLQLYCARGLMKRLSVTRLAELSGVALTSTKRWLDYLEREQLVGRTRAQDDYRSGEIALTDRGARLMDGWLDGLAADRAATRA